MYGIPIGGRNTTRKYAPILRKDSVCTILWESSLLVWRLALTSACNLRFSSWSSSLESFFLFLFSAVDLLSYFPSLKSSEYRLKKGFGRTESFLIPSNRLSFSCLLVASDNEWCVDQCGSTEDDDNLPYSTHNVTGRSEEAEDSTWCCPWSVDNHQWAQTDRCNKVT